MLPVRVSAGREKELGQPAMVPARVPSAVHALMFAVAFAAAALAINGVAWVLSDFAARVHAGMDEIDVFAPFPEPYLNRTTGALAIGLVVLFAGFGVHSWLVVAVRYLATGWRPPSFFEKGIVRGREVVTWDRVAEVQCHIRGGRLLWLTVIVLVGRRWSMKALGPRERMHALAEAARGHGRPVVQAPRNPELRPDGPAVGPFLLIFGLAAGALLALLGQRLGALGQGGKIVWGTAAAGLLLVNTGAWLVFNRSKIVRIFVALNVTIAEFIVIGLVQGTLPSPAGWLVGCVVVAFSWLTVWFFLRLAGGLVWRIGAAQRWLYAATHHWGHRARQPIDLPSAATAARLLDVPPDAASAVGRSVLTFDVDGWRVTVFSRVRRWPHLDDRPQTVWLVHLPRAVGFRSLGNPWSPPVVDRHLMLNQLRFSEEAWVDGAGYWYAEHTDDRKGTRCAEIERMATLLVTKAAAIAGGA